MEKKTYTKNGHEYRESFNGGAVSNDEPTEEEVNAVNAAIRDAGERLSEVTDLLQDVFEELNVELAKYGRKALYSPMFLEYVPMVEFKHGTIEEADYCERIMKEYPNTDEIPFKEIRKIKGVVDNLKDVNLSGIGTPIEALGRMIFRLVRDEPEVRSDLAARMLHQNIMKDITEDLQDGGLAGLVQNLREHVEDIKRQIDEEEQAAKKAPRKKPQGKGKVVTLGKNSSTH